MQNLLNEIKSNKIYFYTFIFLLFLSFSCIGFYGKSASFIFLNSYHSFWLNFFFINYTFIGDGIFACCLIGLLYFYFKNKNLAINVFYSFLISGLGAQIIKNMVNSPRPKLYFEPGTYLNFIDGVSKSGYSSFPSGHTATAFAIATVLVLTMKNKNWQLLILSAAVLVGYSRVYLAQHFLIDVTI
jgi:membrane-associated phospholipid phosphatase